MGNKITNYEEILLNKGFELVDYVTRNKIIAKDNEGYYYKINIVNLLQGKSPSFMYSNPYAIYNFKRYLSIHYPDYELLDNNYVDSKTKMKFICKRHLENGIQMNNTSNIIHSGHACKYCSYDRLGEERKIDDDIIKQRCEELNITYKGRHSKNNATWVKYICNSHIDKGIQEIAWDHLKTCAKGCPYCIGRHKTTQDFIEEISMINPNIKIIGEYRGSERPVECKCLLCEHTWNPIGRSVKYGQGCPNCSSSNGEIKIKQFLDSHNVPYNTEHTFEDCIDKKKLRFDFFIDKASLAIEYDGEQHFRPVDFSGKGFDWANDQFVKSQKRDEIKNSFCKKNNITLIRIPYYEFNNIESILTPVLLGVIFD